MSVRRSRRLAGLEPILDNTVVVKEKVTSVKGAEAPKIMHMISQYLFFLVWTTFLVRGVLLR
jgi:hypothetical protein